MTPWPGSIIYLEPIRRHRGAGARTAARPGRWAWGSSAGEQVEGSGAGEKAREQAGSGRGNGGAAREVGAEERAGQQWHGQGGGRNGVALGRRRRERGSGDAEERRWGASKGAGNRSARGRRRLLRLADWRRAGRRLPSLRERQATGPWEGTPRLGGGERRWEAGTEAGNGGGRGNRGATREAGAATTPWPGRWAWASSDREQETRKRKQRRWGAGGTRKQRWEGGVGEEDQQRGTSDTGKQATREEAELGSRSGHARGCRRLLRLGHAKYPPPLRAWGNGCRAGEDTLSRGERRQGRANAPLA